MRDSQTFWKWMASRATQSKMTDLPAGFQEFPIPFGPNLDSFIGGRVLLKF